MRTVSIVAGTLFVGLLFGATSALAQTSPSVYACAGPQGQLRAVSGPSECRPSESPLSWNQQGVQGEPGPAGQDGAPGSPGEQGPAGPDAGLNVVDASGVVIGRFTGPGDAVVVSPDPANKLVIAVNSLGFVWPISPAARAFNSTDCSGPVHYAVAQAVPLVNRVHYYLDQATGTLVYADYAATPVFQTVVSLKTIGPPTFPPMQPSEICLTFSPAFLVPVKNWTLPFFATPLKLQ